MNQTIMTQAKQTELAVGQQAEPCTFPPLTRTDFVKYQGASGDFHPLHHDEPFAQKTGFPTVFSVWGGHVGLYQGWSIAHEVNRDSRWTVGELTAQLADWPVHVKVNRQRVPL